MMLRYSKRILLWVFIFLSIGICVVGYVSYTSLNRQIRISQENELEAISNLKKNQILNWRSERFGDAQVIRDNSIVATAYSQYLETHSPVVYNDLIRWMDSLIKNYGYSEVVLLDRKGEIQLIRGTLDKGIGPEIFNSILSSISSGHVVFGNFHYGNINKIHIDLIVPLVKQDGPHLISPGAILLRIDPNQFLYPLIQNWPTPSKTAETLLITKEGNDVLFLNELRHRKNTALRLKIPMKKMDLPAARAINGEKGIVEGKDYRGVNVVAHIDQIPGTSWCMVAKVDRNEIYAPIWMMGLSVLIIVLMMLAGTAGIIYLFWKKQEEDWFWHQYQDVKERELLLEKYEILSRYANDMILLLDEKLLILEANEKALEVYGYSRDHFIGMNAASLRPDELQDSISKAIQVMDSENTAIYETTHIKADGSLFPIEVSGRKFTKEGKAFYQLIIRDISERKESEKKVLESEARFRAIYENVMEGVILLEGEHFLEVNPRGSQILGYTREELIGKTPMDICPPQQIDGAESIGKMKELIKRVYQGEVLHFEWEALKPEGGGTELDISSSRVMIGDKMYLLAVFKDISNLKKTAGRWTKINDCFLKFQANPLENIHSLTRLCGEVFNADMVVYNRLVGDELRTLSHWNMPEDYIPVVATKGLVCHDVMDGEGAFPLLVSYLVNSKYAALDPNIKKQGFQTYYGKAIQTDERKVGTLCLFFRRDFQPDVEDEKLLGIFASAISTEDQRRIILDELHDNESLLRNVLETLPVGVWFADKEGNLILANQAGIDIWGSSINTDKKGYGNFKGWWPDTGEQIKEEEWSLYRTINSGKSILGEIIKIEAFDGQIKTIINSSVPIRNLQGEQMGAIVVNQDITRLQKAETDLEIQLEHMKALRTIDQTITGSVDMQVNLSLIVRETIRQLKVDAVDILLYNPTIQRLEFAVGEGFQTASLKRTRLRFGDGFAGIAALERHLVSVYDLDQRPEVFKESLSFSREGFHCYHGIPLIAKGQVKGVMELFHRQDFTPDPNWLEFLDALATQTAIAIDSASLFENIERSRLELMMAYESTLEGWSRALDLRDKETEGHTQRVTLMTVQLAEKMGFEGQKMTGVRRGALLHDIGKMGVPDQILHKPGPLNDEEWVIMKKHPVFAFEMLAPIQYLKEAIEIPYCHHEKWDGTGYPRGLKGEMIPLPARIFAVIDVWDALSSDRPYRKAWTHEKVMAHIQEQSGTHFDPAVVEAFFDLMKDSS